MRTIKPMRRAAYVVSVASVHPSDFHTHQSHVTVSSTYHTYVGGREPASSPRRYAHDFIPESFQVRLVIPRSE